MSEGYKVYSLATNGVEFEFVEEYDDLRVAIYESLKLFPEGDEETVIMHRKSIAAWISHAPEDHSVAEVQLTDSKSLPIRYRCTYVEVAGRVHTNIILLK